jgi:predicted adenylyl cyclase CyaB
MLSIEIKAKTNNTNKIKKILAELKADYKGEDHQIDTYFKCNNGRLKLRSGNIENSLIFYDRNDNVYPKKSEIILEKLEKDNKLKTILAAGIGIKVEVDKRRNIYFIDNVKFHVDDVKNLGSFVEIEAIDQIGNIGETKLHEQCMHYIELLEISKSDFINKSYSDMLLDNIVLQECC